MQWLKQSGIILGTALASAALTYKFSHTTPNNPAEANKTTAIETPKPMPLTLQAECLPDQTNLSATSNIAPASQKTQEAVELEQNESKALKTTVAETTAEIRESLTKTITQEVYKRIDRERQHVDSIRNFLDSQKAEDYNQVLRERYENEELDYDWAVQKEDQLYQLLDNDESLSHIAPLSVSCKSENCQIILPSNDQKEASEIFANFSTAATSSDGSNPQLSVSYFAEPGSGELTLYISDMGNNSLFEFRDEE